MEGRLDLLKDLKGVLKTFTQKKELERYLLVIRPLSMIENESLESKVDAIQTFVEEQKQAITEQINEKLDMKTEEINKKQQENKEEINKKLQAI